MTSFMANASNDANSNKSQKIPLSDVRTECKLSFHGAAANSYPHSLIWVRAPVRHENDCTDAHSAMKPSKSCVLDTVLYASSGVINLARPAAGPSHSQPPLPWSSSSQHAPNVMNVSQTLVTRTRGFMTKRSSPKRLLARGEAVEDAAAPRCITALAWIDKIASSTHKDYDETRHDQMQCYFIAASFSDGTVTSWRWDDFDGSWTENVLIGDDPLQDGETYTAEPIYEHDSISDISGIGLNRNTLIVSTASSGGVLVHVANLDTDVTNRLHSQKIVSHAASSVFIACHANSSKNDNNVQECFLFSGSASPRHNKVWVHSLHFQTIANDSTAYDGNKTCDKFPHAAEVSWVTLPLVIIGEPCYHGCLLGHQDWITCFAWLNLTSSPCMNFYEEKGQGVLGNEQIGSKSEANHRNCEEHLLASSGHDSKIRLWRFTTALSGHTDEKASTFLDRSVDFDAINQENNNRNDIVSDSECNDEDQADIDDLEEEGEARLIVKHSRSSRYLSTAITLEALLLGHEEAVTSLMWKKKTASDKPCLLSSSMDRTILLWMEEDQSMYDGQDGNTNDYRDEGNKASERSGGVWVPISRVGSAGGILGGSLGSSLVGFVDAHFSPRGDRIVGHGYGGSLHFWTHIGHYHEEKFASKEEKEVTEGKNEQEAFTSNNTRWIADQCITGHFRSVEDLAWDPLGEYLLTVGLDQTTRLWAEVPISESSNSEYVPPSIWKEVARPQVHGYDMTSITCVGGHTCVTKGSAGNCEPHHRFVSGADEKVLRVFDAPKSTLRLLHSLKCSRDPHCNAIKNEHSNEIEDGTYSWRVERAFMPSLGLSNKATADTDGNENPKFAGAMNDEFMGDVEDGFIEGISGLSSMWELPLERDLGASTLWPETKKLFGHESEVVCLDAFCAVSSQFESEGDLLTTNMSLVASSCKARNDIASASIRLWSIKNWKCVGILKGGHRSTVSTMSFSKDGNYLASSGKDRRICIWRKSHQSLRGDTSGGYHLAAAIDSAHKRIVWSVHFCPAKTNILASASRDGFVKVWCVAETTEAELEMKETFRFEPASKHGKKPEAVTAVSFAENLLCGDLKPEYGILAIGIESGIIEVWAIPASRDIYDNRQAVGPVLLHAITSNEGHFDAVKKLAWRPPPKMQQLQKNRKKDSFLLPDLTLASCGKDCGVRLYQLKIMNSHCR